MDDLDDFDDPARPPAAPLGPRATRLAGYLWAGAGGLGALQGLAHLAVNGLAMVSRESPLGSRGYAGCCLGELFAAACLGAGLYTASGRAAGWGVLVFALNSLAFGLMCGCMGVVSWSYVRHVAPDERGAVSLVAALDGLQGAVLMVAAALALAGLPAYRAWQRPAGWPPGR